MSPAATLLVGGGGLLGRSLSRAASARGSAVVVARVRWASDDAAADLERALDDLVRTADGGPWRILWCAGAGVTSTGRTSLDAEVRTFAGFLAAVGRATTGRLDADHGSIFVSSSVGGVYAGSSDPPFTEHSAVSPLSDYGASKLAIEQTLASACAEHGLRGFVGRITNIYGPGQNLAKPQGLVSHLCRSHLTGTPVGVYVSLDTLRDYLYVDDCSALVLDSLDRLEATVERGSVVVKILASHRSVSVGALIQEARRVLHRPLRVLLASSPAAAGQTRDLRVRSVVWPDLDERTLQTMPAGIAATALDVALRMRQADSG